MFFTFPEDARWNNAQQAVEFGVEIGEYRVWCGCRVAASSAYCRSGPPPSGAWRRTISGGPGSRASLSESCAAADEQGWERRR